MYIYIYIYIYLSTFATLEHNMFKKSHENKHKPQSPITPGIKVAAANLQLSTLSEGVGGDMARATYKMTSPMRILYYGLGVATYIPPTLCSYSY